MYGTLNAIDSDIVHHALENNSYVVKLYYTFV